MVVYNTGWRYRVTNVSAHGSMSVYQNLRFFEIAGAERVAGSMRGLIARADGTSVEEVLRAVIDRLRYEYSFTPTDNIAAAGKGVEFALRALAASDARSVLAAAFDLQSSVAGGGSSYNPDPDTIEGFESVRRDVERARKYGHTAGDNAYRILEKGPPEKSQTQKETRQMEDETTKAPEVQINFRAHCDTLRSDIEDLKLAVSFTKSEYRKTDIAPGEDRNEALANLTLAYRHLEDARMRIGKAIQAYDGGQSIYDKAKEEKPESPETKAAGLPPAEEKSPSAPQD